MDVGSAHDFRHPSHNLIRRLSGHCALSRGNGDLVTQRYVLDLHRVRVGGITSLWKASVCLGRTANSVRARDLAQHFS